MNGSKKVSKTLQRFLDACSGILGNQYHFIASKKEKEIVEIARKNASNFDMIVGIGGDGTINEILNGLLTSEVSELPILAIIPIGTGNDIYQSSFFKTFHFDLFTH